MKNSEFQNQNSLSEKMEQEELLDLLRKILGKISDIFSRIIMSTPFVNHCPQHVSKIFANTIGLSHRKINLEACKVIFFNKHSCFLLHCEKINCQRLIFFDENLSIFARIWHFLIKLNKYCHIYQKK